MNTKASVPASGAAKYTEPWRAGLPALGGPTSMAPICRAGLFAWWLYSLSFTRVKGPSVFCFSNIRPAGSVKKYIFRRKKCKKCTVATTIKRKKFHELIIPAGETSLGGGAPKSLRVQRATGGAREGQ